MKIAFHCGALVGTLMALAPEIQEFLAARATSGTPEVWQAPVQVLRTATYGRIALAGNPEEVFSIENRYIPGPSADLHVRIYRPKQEKRSPALVYFHGGGWVFNFLDIYDAELTTLANASGSVVIAVNYQKAPEHPYPTPLDDCYATYLWAYDNSQSLGIDASRIGVGGESAGGNLAAAVALKARDENAPRPAYQLLINPCLERNFETQSYKSYASGYSLSRQGMQWYWDQYLQGDLYDNDPYACPLVAQNLADLPPTIVITAECDPLKDDGIKYEQRLRENGTRTFYKEYAGMIHGFTNLGRITPVAKEAIVDCGRMIQSIVS